MRGPLGAMDPDKIPVVGKKQADLGRLGELCDLSPGILCAWQEAASVMLDKFHPVPPPPTSASLTHDEAPSTLDLTWTKPTTQMMESHANEKDATEDAAYGVAIAAAHHCGYRVRRRTHHGSGSDLLMVRHGEPDNDFVKLEVSGIARGRALEGRLAEKIREVGKGDLDRPGVALVVGFEAAAILVKRRA